YAIERHQVEQRARERERLFRLLADNAQDLIFRYRLRPEPGFDYISPAAVAMTGYTAAELCAEPSLFTSLVSAEHLEPMARMARSGRLAAPMEVAVRRKDGSTIWVEQRLAPRSG